MSFETMPEEPFGPEDGDEISYRSSGAMGDDILDSVESTRGSQYDDIQTLNTEDVDDGSNLESIRAKVAARHSIVDERIKGEEDIKSYRISSHGDLRPVGSSLYPDTDFSNGQPAEYNISDTKEFGNESEASEVSDSGVRPPEVIKPLKPLKPKFGPDDNH